MPAWGATAAGFATKPVSAILAGMQQQAWDTIDTTLDLSANTADGQMLGIVANEAGSNWDLLQVAYNQYNRDDTEGAGLDNVGDLTGTPREGESFSQVYCTLTLDPAHAPYAAGSLVANVVGQPGQLYANFLTITAAMIGPNVAVVNCTSSGGLIEVQVASATGVTSGAAVTLSGVLGTTEANGTWVLTVVDATHFTLNGSTFSNAYVGGGIATYGTAAIALFQALVGGEVPAVNDNTLNTITTAVTGWSAVNNPGPGSQTQVGTNAELDPAYMVRQVQDLAASGSCNPSATAEALMQFANDLQPPVSINVQVLENPQWYWQIINGVGVAPHSYTVVVYDATGTLTAAQIGGVIYANKPAGMVPTGQIPVVVADPVLGNQTVYYDVPAPLPLFITATTNLRPGVSPTSAAAAIRAALVAAAVAPTPANGEPLPGQLVPGASVYGSQLEAVIMGVPGVLNVPALAFDFHSSPSNTAPLGVSAAQVATIAAATSATNIQLTFA
jgi:hypothetical protein